MFKRSALRVWAIYSSFVSNKGSETIYAFKRLNGFKIRAMIFSREGSCQSLIPYSWFQPSLNNKENLFPHITEKPKAKANVKKSLSSFGSSHSYTLLHVSTLSSGLWWYSSFQRFPGLHFSKVPPSKWIKS